MTHPQRVILTHENADFDAVASLWAMHKLEPTAVPVLPARINRNVSQFLMLYAREWAMLRAEDLRRGGHVVQAYVVDTQTFNMVRGMQPDTPVQIIDHHALARDLPEHYRFQNDEVGANTTLLVEQLLERGRGVDALEATLFLLGIYEDTGNLTFKSTTPRDMRAAAWLLDAGADLDVLREFLQHSMSPAQAQLYEGLQQAATTHRVHGHQVIVSGIVHHDHVRELALVASQLLAIFACDVLIIAIQVHENVQMIGRASIDEIDLGALMRDFGGNGHTRAAAALVRAAKLDDVLSQVVARLPQVLHPAAQVGALMSRGVIQTVDAQTSVADAQAQMLESGHEGYPVLHDGELVGLVTRRAIDRAMLHNMHKLSVAEVMDAEQHFVRPDHSIDELKDLMLATRWGQMPVIDDAGQLIGIVTRTDLIKHWGRPSDESGAQPAVLAQMQKVLSGDVWRILEAVREAADLFHEGVFLVGGIVRDILLERPNLDLDLVVEGDAIRLARHLQARYGGEIHQHKQFGTATWKLDAGAYRELGLAQQPEAPEVIDFATARAEFYEAPSALPTVRRGSIKLDLHRRDFTINAMAIRLAPQPMGQLMDFYNGEHDLRHGLIRVLHSLSFVDDPTRMLRAVRFEQRFDFEIEARTAARIPLALSLLDRVSGDRLRHELNAILNEPDRVASLQRLQGLGILPAIHPALDLTSDAFEALHALEAFKATPPWPLEAFEDWNLAALALIVADQDEDAIRQVAARLLLARQHTDQLVAARRAYTARETITKGAVSEFVLRYEAWGEIAWIVTWVRYPDPNARARLARLAREWRHMRPTLDGYALREMGLKPGPSMGVLLARLRAAWLDGDVKDEDDERAFARHYIQATVAKPDD